MIDVTTKTISKVGKKKEKQNKNSTKQIERSEPLISVIKNMTCPISHSRLKSAVEALCRNIEINDDETKLLKPVQMINLYIVLHKKNPLFQRHLFPLPHSLFTESSHCMFVKDVVRGDAEKTVEFYEHQFKDINSSIKFIPLSSLRKDYKLPEIREILAKSHRLFLVDNKIVKMIPALLGKPFFENAAYRCLSPVNPHHPNVEKHYRQILNSTCWYMNGTLTHSRITVALSTFNVDEIVENLESCLKGIAAKVLRGWENVRELYLKCDSTLPYPIYVNNDPSEELEIPDAIEVARKQKTDTKNIGSDLYTMNARAIRKLTNKGLREMFAAKKRKQSDWIADSEAVLIDELSAENEEENNVDEHESEVEDSN